MEIKERPHKPEIPSQITYQKSRKPKNFNFGTNQELRSIKKRKGGKGKKLFAVKPVENIAKATILLAKKARMLKT